MYPEIRMCALAFLLTLMTGGTAWAEDENTARLEERIAQVKEHLDLSEEQVEQITPILKSALEAQKELLEDTDIARDGRRERDWKNVRQARQMRDRTNEIRENTRKELAAVLTEEQLEKYDEMQEERKAAMRERARDRR